MSGKLGSNSLEKQLSVVGPIGRKRLPNGEAVCDQYLMAKRQKNAAAVALGRLGGLKGGKARARKLTAEQRRESARKAAAARWATKKGSKDA